MTRAGLITIFVFHTVGYFLLCLVLLVLNYIYRPSDITPFSAIYSIIYMLNFNFVFHLLQFGFGLILHRYNLLWLSYVLEVLVWGVTAASFYVYFKVGLHLDQPLMGGALNMEGGNHGVPINAVEQVLLFFYLLLVLILLKLAHTFQKKQRFDFGCHGYKSLIRVLSLVFIFSFFLKMTFSYDRDNLASEMSLPGFYFMSKVFEDKPKEYLHASAHQFQPQKMKSKDNIVIILIESLRWDKLNPNNTPFLYSLTRRPECSPSSRHYASGHLTMHSAFSMLYGLDSYFMGPFLKQKIASPALQNLRMNGYSLKAFDASGVTTYNPPIIDVRQFDEYNTFLERTETGDYDTLMVDRFIDSWNKNKNPTFHFIFFYASHYNYAYPQSHSKHKPDDQIQNLHNRYLNSLSYIDEQVRRVVEKIGDDAIFVITGDHGEDFNEYGAFGHVSPQFEDVRVRVPLIFCQNTKTWSRVDLSSHVDIWPTIFDISGVDREWIYKVFSGGSFLEDAFSVDKKVYLSGGFIYDFPDFITVIDKSYKTQLEVRYENEKLQLRAFRLLSNKDQSLQFIEPKLKEAKDSLRERMLMYLSDAVLGEDK